MEVYLVRHGIAEPQGGGPDSERALTSRGRVRTRQVALGLQAADCRPAVIATSPLRRAKETAEIMARELCPEARIEECTFLEPGAVASDLVSWLGELDADAAMVVGHAPDMGEMAAQLLCKHGDVAMTFKKAGACCVSFSGAAALGSGILEWLIQPRLLTTCEKV